MPPASNTAEANVQEEQLRQLAERAQNGDQDAVLLLRPFLDSAPQLWRQASDLAALAEAAWIKQIADDNELVAEGLRRRLQEMREEYEGSSATPIERLLSQRITITWLQVQHADLAAASLPEGSSLGHVRFIHQRLDSFQNRHLSAIRALGNWRRLAGKRRNMASNEKSSRRPISREDDANFVR